MQKVINGMKMDFDIILLKCSDVAQLNPLYVYNLVQVIKKTYLNS